MQETIVAKLESREALVAIIGQGYVGLSVGLAAAVAGLEVIGLDVSADRVQALSEGRLVVPGVGEPEFRAGVSTGRMRFATSPAVLAEADVILICVPTPVHEHRPDLTAVEAAGEAIGRHAKPGCLVVLESTTYPGTTEEVLVPRIEAHGLRVRRDIMVAYSPERIDPGNASFGFRDVPRVVGGVDDASTSAAVEFYSMLVDTVHVVSSTRAAEMAKLLENTYRMVNIALVNELAMLCHDQALSPWEVIAAAASKPFGFAKFLPGPGVGGHCIPVDPTYLTWQSRRDTGRPYRLVELANDVNAEMPSYVAGRVADVLNDLGKAVKGSRVLVLGVTYKPDVGDIRESAAIHIMARLARKGALTSFHDPFIETVEDDAKHWTCVPLDEATVGTADLVALLTPHSSYDLDWLRDNARHIFDARNAFGSAEEVKVTAL